MTLTGHVKLNSMISRIHWSRELNAMSTRAITDWCEDLAEKIRSLGPDDWEESVLVNKGGIACLLVRYKEFHITIGNITPEMKKRLVGKVNDRELACTPAGHLLIKGIKWGDPPGCWKMSLLLNQQPWNTTYNPSEVTFVDFRDAVGQLVYEATDFGVILPPA